MNHRRKHSTNDARPKAPQHEKRADQKWTEAEHTTPQADAAANELIERTGSKERAKYAVDTVDEGHPP